MNEQGRLRQETVAKLRTPVPAEEVRWKAQVVDKEKGRAMMVAYVDARWVSEKLDEATGGDWEFRYELLELVGDSVVVKGVLTVCGVTREDVGQYHGGQDSDSFKAAVSDALKRSAVLFGVGASVYGYPKAWVNYDARTKRPSDADMEALVSSLSERQRVDEIDDGEEAERETERRAERPVERQAAPEGNDKPVTWDSQTITKFWKMVREKGKRQADVNSAVGGDILKYTGTWDDLVALVEGLAS